MPKPLLDFLVEIATICALRSHEALTATLQAFAVAIYAQILRLEQDRISHRSHPLRVLDLVLVALAAETTEPRIRALPLGLTALGHDLAPVRKITSAKVATLPPEDQSAAHDARLVTRMLHEAEGTSELIRGGMAANLMLGEMGHAVVKPSDLYISARVSAVHDTPSLREPLPYTPGCALSASLALFVQCDGLAMLDFGRGLKSQVPLGPMVEIWANGGDWHASGAVGEQAVSAVKSLRSRMQKAFGHPKERPLPDCFPNPALKEVVLQRLAEWQGETGFDLRGPAGL